MGGELTGGTSSVAAVGCGYWGENLVRDLNEFGALAMVCDAIEAGAASAAGLAPEVEHTEDLSDVTSRARSSGS